MMKEQALDQSVNAKLDELERPSAPREFQRFKCFLKKKMAERKGIIL